MRREYEYMPAEIIFSPDRTIIKVNGQVIECYLDRISMVVYENNESKLLDISEEIKKVIFSHDKA